MFGIWKPLGEKECSSNFPLDWTLFIKESGNDARKQMVHWFSFHCGKNKEKRSTLEDIPFFRKMSSGKACSVGFSPEKKNSFSLQMEAYRLKVRKKSEGYSAQATTVLKHGAILNNEAEVFSLSITNPNGRPMLPFDWLIHSSLILASCHRILFFHRFSAVEK